MNDDFVVIASIEMLIHDQMVKRDARYPKKLWKSFTETEKSEKREMAINGIYNLYHQILGAQGNG